MSVSAMKCALQSLESVEKVNGWNKDSIVGRHCTQSAHFLRQAIAEAEKQEPVAFRNTETGEFCTGGFLRKDWAKWQPLYAAPVHASDEFAEMVKKGTKAWADTPDDWVDDLRGGAEKQDLDDGKWEPKIFRQYSFSGDLISIKIQRTKDGELEVIHPRVDETAKSEHEFECPRCGHCCREWVGLTDEEIVDLACSVDSYKGLCQATEAKLKEKNT